MEQATATLAKERRRHPRSTVMLPALLDQHPVTVTDISLGGIGTGDIQMMIDGELGPSRGQRASLRFLDQDESFGEDGIEVEVMRVSTQRGTLGVRYVALTPEQSAMIQRLAQKAAA